MSLSIQAQPIRIVQIWGEWSVIWEPFTVFLSEIFGLERLHKYSLVSCSSLWIMLCSLSNSLLHELWNEVNHSSLLSFFASFRFLTFIIKMSHYFSPLLCDIHNAQVWSYKIQGICGRFSLIMCAVLDMNLKFSDVCREI